VDRRLRSLFVVAVIDVLGFGILIPLVPYMGERFGARPALITAILGSYSLCQFLAAPFWGRLSDRYGRRPILVSSLAGACLSYVILGLSNSLGWLLLSRMLAGFMAGNLAAAFAYASDVSTPAERAKSLGLVGAAIGVGFMLGLPIGGVLAGDNPQHANFIRPAVVSASLSLLAIALVVLRLPESRVAPAARPDARARPLTLLRERAGLRLVAAAALLVTSSQGILESIFAIWALQRFGAGPRTVGIALFGVAAVTVLMQGGGVRVLVPRFGESRLGACGALLYTAGLIVVAAAGSSRALVGAGLVLCGAGVGAFNPSASALASKQAGASERGAVMGTYQASTSLARVIGPFISGPIYAWLGADAPFLAGACFTLPAAWLVWQARRFAMES
jgi:DHA1 family tetracycline resistance protein-like MFS transporter